jgi:predicted adenine nucleotide alpha hydrolase (AANH) superfamily ATPase
VRHTGCARCTTGVLRRTYQARDLFLYFAQPISQAPRNDETRIQKIFATVLELSRDFDFATLRYNEHPDWTSVAHMSIVRASRWSST